MQINFGSDKKLGKYVEINSEGKMLKIFADEVKGDISPKDDEIRVFTSTHVDADTATHFVKGSGMDIYDAGEYEKSGIFIYAQKNTGDDYLSTVEVESEGVRTIFYGSELEVDKELLSEMGLIDVMILYVRKEFSAQVKAIASIDPQILLPIFEEGVDIEAFKSKSGIKFDEDKKYKCKSTDFANEEYVVHGLILDGAK